MHMWGLRKANFIIFLCFWSFSTMRMHGQAWVHWLKYTTLSMWCKVISSRKNTCLRPIFSVTLAWNTKKLVTCIPVKHLWQMHSTFHYFRSFQCIYVHFFASSVFKGADNCANYFSLGVKHINLQIKQRLNQHSKCHCESGSSTNECHKVWMVVMVRWWVTR